MSKKSKGVAFDEDAKARLKHQTLLQDYEELQKVPLFQFLLWVLVLILLFARSDDLLIVCFLGFGMICLIFRLVIV